MNESDRKVEKEHGPREWKGKKKSITMRIQRSDIDKERNMRRKRKGFSDRDKAGVNTPVYSVHTHSLGGELQLELAAAHSSDPSQQRMDGRMGMWV
jgi:hypothetical protein